MDFSHHRKFILLRIIGYNSRLIINYIYKYACSCKEVCIIPFGIFPNNVINLNSFFKRCVSKILHSNLSIQNIKKIIASFLGSVAEANIFRTHYYLMYDKHNTLEHFLNSMYLYYLLMWTSKITNTTWDRRNVIF